MTRSPIISVVMPAYNAARYISLAIESILNQTLRDFELLIIEDSSPDNTHEVIKRYADSDPRIIPILNERNIGLTPSLNKGLDMARGEFIARMDADDISYPARLEKQVSYLNANSDVCMVATSFERIDEEGKVISSQRMNPGKERLKRMIEITNSVAHGSVVFRRKEVISLGKYREGIRYAEDYDLWLRIIEHYNIDILPDVLYQFRLTHQSRTVSEGAQDKYYFNLVKQFAMERKESGKDSYKAEIKPKTMVETSFRLKDELYHLYRGLEYLASNMRKEALYDFRDCIIHNPKRILYWALLAAAVAPTPVLDVVRWFWRKSPRNIH